MLVWREKLDLPLSVSVTGWLKDVSSSNIRRGPTHGIWDDLALAKSELEILASERAAS